MYWKFGGYVSHRGVRIKGLGWVPHAIWSKKLPEDCQHMAGNTNKHWIIELWYAVTGQHYEERIGDDPEKREKKGND
jgi:hypothetical protein